MILVTVIGLACGLELYVVAVLTTALAWVLIYVLERQSVERLVIQGLEKGDFSRASEVHVVALRELGCTILGEDKRVKKGSLAIVFRAPQGVGRAQLEQRLAELPEDARGTISWEQS